MAKKNAREITRYERPYALAKYDDAGLRIDDHDHDIYTFNSLSEYWEAAQAARGRAPAGRYEWRTDNPKWLPPIKGWRELMEMSVRGWQAVVDQNASFNDEMLASALKRTKAIAPVEVNELAGSFVDVPLYSTGAPESMVTYEDMPTTRRAVTLVVSCTYSWSVDSASRVKLGMALVAACRVLETRGVVTRIFADVTVADDCTVKYPDGRWEPRYVPKGNMRTLRVMLKDYSDPGDLDIIAFGIAHPAFLRVAAFYLNDGSTRKFRSQGIPCDPILETYGEDENAIVVPAVLTSSKDAGDTLIDAILAKVFAGG